MCSPMRAEALSVFGWIDCIMQAAYICVSLHIQHVLQLPMNGGRCICGSPATQHCSLPEHLQAMHGTRASPEQHA